MGGRVVLVTGASRLLGGRLASILAADPRFSTVIGVDAVPPSVPLPGVTFVRADIRNPVIASVMGEARVDTVVHMGVISTPRQAGSRAAMKEINVIGTMQLLAACQRTPSVQQVVTKSTAAVYGSGPKDPTAFTEDTVPPHPPTSGWAKDSLDVEAYLRGLARRRLETTVATVRFANVIGPSIRTAMTEYFSLPLVPTVLGYDPRLQFTHEDDCLAVMAAVAAEPRPGIVNAAGDGVLLLSQAIRRTGRPSVPIAQPLYPSVARALGRARGVDVSREQVRFLTYGRVLDTARLRETYGTTLRHTSAQAFDDFAATVRRG